MAVDEKPSIIYWLFSIILWVSLFNAKTILQRMLGDKISMPTKIWTRLTHLWAIFFFVMGFLNVYVIYNFDTNSWVNFKLFGTLGLTLVFIIAQAFYMAKHMEQTKEVEKQPKQEQ